MDDIGGKPIGGCGLVGGAGQDLPGRQLECLSPGVLEAEAKQVHSFDPSIGLVHLVVLGMSPMVVAVAGSWVAHTTGRAPGLSTGGPSRY